MQDKFIKARVPHAEYEALLARAGAAGQRLGTFVREILERDAQVLTTEQALARIEAALASNTSPPMSVPDHELHRQVQEMRLIVREIAMHANAQILNRVAAQIAAHASPNNASRSV
jgi:hypothetical protein